MKVEIEWTTTTIESHKATLDWEEDLTPRMRREIEGEVDMEDGSWPALNQRHELSELDTSDQLADFENEESEVGSDVENRYTTGITFRDPTIDEVQPRETVEDVEQKIEKGRATLAGLNLERAIQLVKSNGYDVTKRRDPGREYVDGLFEFARRAPQRLITTDHEQAKLGQLVNAVGLQAEHDAIEIYVEVDRDLLRDTIVQSGGDPIKVVGTALWSHLWPVVIRVDEGGDIVLHTTSGERVQFGQDDVTAPHMRTVN